MKPATPPDRPRYLTLPEAAEIARTSVETVRYWVWMRKLRAHKPGRRVLIKESDLLAFIEAPTKR